MYCWSICKRHESLDYESRTYLLRVEWHLLMHVVLLLWDELRGALPAHGLLVVLWHVHFLVGHWWETHIWLHLLLLILLLLRVHPLSLVVPRELLLISRHCPSISLCPFGFAAIRLLLLLHWRVSEILWRRNLF